MLKILHPADTPTDEEFDEYVSYAIECRRRVKEQMDKRKPDDEFARIDLSFLNRSGEEIVVRCPETMHASATLEPARRRLRAKVTEAPTAAVTSLPSPAISSGSESPAPEPVSSLEPGRPAEQHYVIAYGDTGYSFDTIFGPYLPGVVTIEDLYIRTSHQISNFVRFCGTVDGGEGSHGEEGHADHLV